MSKLRTYRTEFSPANPPITTTGSGNSVATFFADATTISALPASTYSANVITASSNGVLPSQDGIILTNGQLLLVQNQISKLQNGLYEVTDLGSISTPFILTRPLNYDETSEIYPSQVNVLHGTTQAGKYFLETTANPIIGTDPITYITISQSQSGIYLPLAFVDTVADSALPNTPTYLSGTTLVGNPGYLATYTSSTNTVFPTLQGLTPFVGMKVLITNEADQTKNGNYQLITLGSVSTKWQLRRIFFTGSQFYPVLIEVLAGNLKSAIYQQNNKTLVNANIGISGNITFTNINPSILNTSGIWGIANSSGLYTYYNTLTLAMAAATTGQCIEMFVDVTESGAITIQPKTGVNIDGHGHTYTFTNNTVIPFYDSLTAPTIHIYNLNIVVTTYTGFSFSSSGTTYFTGVNIISTNGEGYSITSGGKLFGGNFVTNLTALNVANTSYATNVYAESTLSTYDGVTASINNAGIIENCTAKRNNGSTGTNLWAIYNTGTATDCEFYSVGDQCAIGGSYIKCTVNCLGYRGFFSVTLCDRCVSNAGTSAYSDVISLINSDGTSAASSSIVGCADYCRKISGGTFICTGGGTCVSRSYDVTKAHIINKTNTVYGTGIYVDNTTSVIINCNIEITYNTVCIDATATANVRYALNSYSGATSPVSANVIQYINVANISDAQGNINTNH